MENKAITINAMTPREIVAELDRFIIGQASAKKAVAIALRNRFRRMRLTGEMQEAIIPKNILMIGPTGVGKTEIARRVAKIAAAPFIKVEATKFTEVGYVGRDVESIIRDLVEIAIRIKRDEMRRLHALIAEKNALKIIIDLLVGEGAGEETRGRFEENILNGKIDRTEIEIDVIDNSNAAGSGFELPSGQGQIGMINITEMISKTMGMDRSKKRKVSISEARKILMAQESDKLIDESKMIEEAINAVQNDGIVFIDELDKLCSEHGSKSSGNVSREGVQRDLLPLIEGTVVPTKYGPINTDHILFIAAGAFHLNKPSDLLPELQGRLPVRVELSDLTEEDLISIMRDTTLNLPEQHCALLATEGVEIKFEDDAIAAIAHFTHQLNREVENIGARRLHTIFEKLLEEVSFSAGDNPTESTIIVINKEYVENKIKELSNKLDLAKFIL